MKKILLALALLLPISGFADLGPSPERKAIEEELTLKRDKLDAELREFLAKNFPVMRQLKDELKVAEKEYLKAMQIRMKLNSRGLSNDKAIREADLAVKNAVDKKNALSAELAPFLAQENKLREEIKAVEKAIALVPFEEFFQSQKKLVRNLPGTAVNQSRVLKQAPSAQDGISTANENKADDAR
jgi:hypothetical protein